MLLQVHQGQHDVISASHKRIAVVRAVMAFTFWGTRQPASRLSCQSCPQLLYCFRHEDWRYVWNWYCCCPCCVSRQRIVRIWGGKILCLGACREAFWGRGVLWNVFSRTFSCWSHFNIAFFAIYYMIARILFAQFFYPWRSPRTYLLSQFVSLSF